MGTREDFDAIDTDDDGFITVDELKESYKDDPNLVASAEWAAAYADKDGDEKITYEEYEKFAR